jgi:cytochrome c oxidase subunit II
MNSTAVVIAVAYGAATLIALLVAVALGRGAGKPRDADHAKLARRENGWFLIVLALLFALLLSTIFLVPYGGGGNEARAAGRRVVEIEGRQFAWVVRPARVRAGTQVEFRIRASDVNHGFGLYDPEDTLVFQVQAVPGELQKEFHTLRRPGRYRIICLEYCGVGHHLMLGSLTVEP